MALSDQQKEISERIWERIRQAAEKHDALPMNEQLEVRINAERFSFKVRSSGPGKPNEDEEQAWDKIMAYFYYWTEGIEYLRKSQWLSEQIDFVLANEGKNYWLLKQEILRELQQKKAEERRLK